MKKMILMMTFCLSASSFASFSVDADKVVADSCAALSLQDQRIFEDALRACDDPELKSSPENFASGITTILKNLKKVKRYNEREKTLRVVREIQQPLYDALHFVQGQAFEERFNY